jgi:hypothetical protein
LATIFRLPHTPRDTCRPRIVCVNGIMPFTIALTKFV